LTRVVCTRPFPGNALARLAARCDLWVGPGEGTPRALLVEKIADADALICGPADAVDEELLSHAPLLRIVSTSAAGTDRIDLDAARAHDLWVCNAPEGPAEATADLTWALILAASRRIVEGDRLMRSGAFVGWSSMQLLGLQVSGATLGVVGAGRIGGAVLRRGRGFGMKLRYHRRGGPLPALDQELGAEYRALDALLGECDVVSLHVPITPATHHLIDAARLAQMKRGAVLVNSSRGAVVDEAALVASLEAGHLRAAGLDVFEHEPQVDPGLLRSDRTVLLPHIGSATEAARSLMAEIAVAAVESVLDGREPKNALVRPRS
jgi:glyoxylate reductase